MFEFGEKQKAVLEEMLKSLSLQDTVKEVEKHLNDFFLHLNVQPEERKTFVKRTLQICAKKASLEEIEKELKSFYSGKGLSEKIKESLSGRSEKIFNQVKDFVEGKSVLDIGSGNGKVAEFISKTGKKIELCDILDYNKSCLPVKVYNDNSPLPYKNKSFDTSLLLTVLHHSNKPLWLFDEARRVTKNRIIVIETTYLTESERKVNSFFDWFNNRILNDELPVPLNFKSLQEWKKIFHFSEWVLTKEIDLGIDQPTAPEHHFLFVLDRN